MRSDEALLIDIYEHAQLVEQRISNTPREAFDADLLFQLGIAHALQIIGEAARQIPENTRVLYPSVPWKQVVGMRHRLVHEYFRINMDRVWDTAQGDVPQLIVLLRPIVQPILDARPPKP